MRRPRLFVGLAALALAVVGTASPASAIRYGEPDAGEHPYVGLMIADVDGAPAWRCSGTLVSPTIFLTAGHCTFGADGARVWFEEDLTDRAAVGYPTGGETSIEGTASTHPDYDDDAFYLNDLGLVVLDEPVLLDEYGALPDLAYFDAFFVKRGQNRQVFTAVGYGLQRSMPAQTGLTEAELVRLQATLKIINQDAAFGEKKAGNSVLFTNNASTGGTCSGDSGGPIFVAGSNVIAAVTSYGINARCAGTGGGYRVDTADDLEWLATFGLVPGENG
ncbi:trypsin-like serine protease [Actinotalea sp. K2]|uniref:S1 family peptidase n=1 Tax=Actinotalea sp. K2 TaxID=2939438 RepID=UPI0020180CAC|nr:trypsin-like serine protease [Actinotalea sp. K2]MCL3861685.1 trypsin-like serine protease [Actinotalea sp. K2]